MPKNVMKLLKPSRNVGRNAFDLSHRHLMTANFGELLPITCIETVPGDYITLRVSDLLRALPMVTSPFMRVKQHIDVWWTPYDYMWHNFEQFLTMKEDSVSSAMKNFDFVPHTTIDSLNDAVNGIDVPYQDVVGRLFPAGASKVLDFLGYGNLTKSSTQGSTGVDYSVNVWRLAQYNKIWYDEYRQKYYDDGYHGLNYQGNTLNAAQLFNFDDLECSSPSSARIEHKRLAAMCQMRYRLWKKDLFTGILPATQFGALSTVPIAGQVDLGTMTGTISGQTNSDLGTHSFVDYSGSLVEPIFDQSKGYSLTPSQVYGSTTAGNVISEIDKDQSGYLQNIHYLNNSGNSVYDVHDHLVSGSATLSGVSGQVTGSGFDILALRKAQAVQIWRENALRAGNRISDNMKAHYGDDAEYDDHRSTFLGSIDAPLNIGDVDSHAQVGTGGNQQLADVAGKGLSSLDKQVMKFKAKKFGCIMVMFSLLPEAEYESQGIDQMNSLLEREDYFQSEYQNTGLSAVSAQNFFYSPTAARLLGFAPAYVAYKQKIDKCFNQFWTSSPFAPWASPKFDVSHYFASGSEVRVPLSLLYINPCLYDQNFGVAVTGEPEMEATSEQVICDFYFDCTAVRQMSVVGLPQNI